MTESGMETSAVAPRPPWHVSALSLLILLPVVATVYVVTRFAWEVDLPVVRVLAAVYAVLGVALVVWRVMSVWRARRV